MKVILNYSPLLTMKCCECGPKVLFDEIILHFSPSLVGEEEELLHLFDFITIWLLRCIHMCDQNNAILHSYAI